MAAGVRLWEADKSSWSKDEEKWWSRKEDVLKAYHQRTWKGSPDDCQFQANFNYKATAKKKNWIVCVSGLE